MFQSVTAALRALAARALDRGRYGPGELVVSTVRGTPVNPTNWNHRVWTPALQHAGLGEWVEEDGERKWRNAYRWHDLRHTCVSRLVEQGADVAVVQAVARHANAAVTVGVYTHLRDRRIAVAAEQFDPGRAPTGHQGG